MPDFEFLPFERVLPQVKDGDAHGRVERDGKEWLFRKCGQLLFVRDSSQAKGEWHTVLQFFMVPCDREAPANPWEEWEDFWEEPPLSYTLEHWKTSWLERSCGRLFRVGDKSQIVAYTPDKGWCAFATLTDFFEHRYTALFRFDIPAPVSEAPSSQLFSWLEAEYQKPDSDLRFALHLANLPASERGLARIETKLETPQRMGQLIRAAMCCINAQRPESTALTILAFALTPRSGYKQFALIGEEHLGIRERTIINRIVRAFEPHLPVETSRLPIALKSSSWNCTLRLSVEAQQSQHGLLEAHVELRRWLVEHWPDGVRKLGKIV